MRKLLSVGIYIAIILSLLVACGKKDEEENTGDDENEKPITEEQPDQEDEDEENKEDKTDEGKENEEEEDLEGTFAADIKVLDVETVLFDQDKVSSFQVEEDTVIEHEELMYVEQDFITEVLDYELTYDEENTFAEIYKGKGEFNYEPSHEDDYGALMDVGQIYVEDLDDYVNITEDEELFKFIEYKGELYLSERFINVFLKDPLNYERRDKALEVGLQAEATNIYDVGITDNSSGGTEVTQNAPDVTIEGKNHEGGVVIKDINSAEKGAEIAINYNYSEMKGFIHNHSDEETIEIKFQYDDGKTLDTISIKPRETYKFDYDVKGEAILKVVAKGKAGTSSKAVIVGELN